MVMDFITITHTPCTTSALLEEKTQIVLNYTFEQRGLRDVVLLTIAQTPIPCIDNERTLIKPIIFV